MAIYSFHLIGSHQSIEMEVAAQTIRDLNVMMSYNRFIEGRLTQRDDDGVLLGMLIATSRIQYVLAVQA